MKIIKIIIRIAELAWVALGGLILWLPANKIHMAVSDRYRDLPITGKELLVVVFLAIAISEWQLWRTRHQTDVKTSWSPLAFVAWAVVQFAVIGFLLFQQFSSGI